jgi:ribosome-binding protein aMBF1 (putative translation factor)
MKMTVEQICEDYLNIKLETAKKKPDNLIRLIEVLIEVKGWSVSKVADKLNSRPETIEKYRKKKVQPKELSDEMQQRIFNYLKIF